MEFFGDYHVHSRNSDGEAGLEEIVKAAGDRGLSEVAITDHGPHVIVSGVDSLQSYQDLLKNINKLDDPPVRVLAGAEANIIDLDGTLDIPAQTYRDLDVLICGLHPYSIPSSLEDGYRLFGRNHLRHLGKRMREKAINANTKAVTAALANNPVDILAHPGLFFEIDVSEVARACIKHEVWFEINCGHHFPEEEQVKTAYQAGADFIVNSDAHSGLSVGLLDYGSHLLKKLGVPAERVFNCRGEGERQWKGKRKG